MFKFFKFIFLLFLASCTGDPNEKKTGANDIVDYSAIEENSVAGTFKEFLEEIPLRKFPVLLDCGLPDGPGSDNLNTAAFTRYHQFIPNIEKYELIYGSVGHSDQFKAIILGQVGDDLYPTLFTYDNNAQIIDSLFLILNPCGGADEYSIPHSRVRIDKGFQITLTDSTRDLEYSANGIDSIIVTKAVYIIKGNGKIVKSDKLK